MRTESIRTDDSGQAYVGSQLQIQIYVNRRNEELTQEIIQVLPALASLRPHLNWVSPLEEEGFVEYQDTSFLKTCGLEHLSDDLMEFWPRRGPVWDALAKVEPKNGMSSSGVLLVEAKSYPGEIYGSGCKAIPESRKKIEGALNRTKEWLGVRMGADWTGPLYQLANRLAHLFFFREVAGVHAWLVNIYFLNDPHSPTNLEEWQSYLKEVKAELGISGLDTAFLADVFLEARDRSELFYSVRIGL